MSFVHPVVSEMRGMSIHIGPHSPICKQACFIWMWIKQIWIRDFAQGPRIIGCQKKALQHEMIIYNTKKCGKYHVLAASPPPIDSHPCKRHPHLSCACATCPLLQQKIGDNIMLHAKDTDSLLLVQRFSETIEFEEHAAMEQCLTYDQRYKAASNSLWAQPSLLHFSFHESDLLATQVTTDDTLNQC